MKKLMRDAFIDVLTERKDLIEDAVVEAIEDIELSVAIEEGKIRVLSLGVQKCAGG